MVMSVPGIYDAQFRAQSTHHTEKTIFKGGGGWKDILMQWLKYNSFGQKSMK